MPLPVTHYATSLTASSTASPQTVAISWSAGDIVVVAIGGDNNTLDWGTPTVTGLTFSLLGSAGPVANGSDTGPAIKVYTSSAAGAGGSGSVSVSRVSGSAGWRFDVWVVTGSPSGIGTSVINLTETAPSLAVGADSTVLYVFNDWNADTNSQAPLTGSGTATERADASAGGFSFYVLDYVGASAGTYSFGPSSYGGLIVAQAAVEVTAGGGGPTAPAQVTGLTAEGRDVSAVLSWTAPANGGSAITDYTVEYKASSSGTWLPFSDGTSTATTATVTGLTNLTAYDFRVSAVNAIGTGTASATATATPVPVSFVAAGAKSSGGTTTISVAYPASSAAGQLALAVRNVWNGTATATAEAGWTSTADLSGGTGTAADSHTSRIHVDRLEQAGSESGSVTFDQAGTPSGALGAMVTYRKPSGATWDVAAATGTDDTHGTGRSVTASTTVAFAPGDVVVVAVSMDTDSSTAFTSPTLTATGITFGTLAERVSPSTGGVTTGNDGNVGVFEATVLSGTATVAPAFSLTGGPSQCGPIAFVRLRSTASAASVNPVGTVVDVRSAVAAVTATSSVNPAATVVAVRSAVGAVTATTAVNPVGTVVDVRSAVADVGVARQVDPVATVVAVRSAVATVTATAAVAPVAARVDVRSAVATVTATTNVNGAATVVAVRSAVANVGLAPSVEPVTAVVAVRSAVATVTATTTVNPAPTVVAVRSAVAAISATANVNGTATVVAVRTAVANVGVVSSVDAVTAVVAVRSAVATVTATTNVNPRATIVAPRAAVAAVTATSTVAPVAALVAVIAAVANVGNSLYPYISRGPRWLLFTTPERDIAFTTPELDLSFTTPERSLSFTEES